MIEEDKGDGVVSALGKVRDEIDSLGVDSATRADSNDDQAHVGTDVPVLAAA